MRTQIPEGAVRFELSPEEVAEAIAEASGEIAPAEDIPVPEALLPDEDLEVLIVQQQPVYVALDGNPDVRPLISLPPSRSCRFHEPAGLGIISLFMMVFCLLGGYCHVWQSSQAPI